MLDEGALPGIPEVRVDAVGNSVLDLQPALDRGRPGQLPRHAQAPVERHPAHQAPGQEGPALAAYFPDALVGLLPVVADPVEGAGHTPPGVDAGWNAVLHGEVGSVDEFAVDVELQLARRGVADADGTRATVAVQVVEFLLGCVAAAIERVEDLQPVVGVALARPFLHPADE